MSNAPPLIVHIRRAYEPHERSQVHFNSPSMAKQSFRDECNINGIMSRYEKTGLLDHVRENQGQYGDYTGVESYHDSLNRVIAAREVFETLPSRIRAQFQNSPGQFFEFCNNPDNHDAMQEMGLLPSPSVTEAAGPEKEPATPAEQEPATEPAPTGDSP